MFLAFDEDGFVGAYEKVSDIDNQFVQPIITKNGKTHSFNLIYDEFNTANGTRVVEA